MITVKQSVTITDPENYLILDQKKYFRTGMLLVVTDITVTRNRIAQREKKDRVKNNKADSQDLVL